MKSARAAAFGWILALAAAPAPALDWSFKAFGTLAAIGTDNDNIGFRRDYTQDYGANSHWGLGTDSRLGLQLDADFSREFHAAVQWVARNHAGNFIEQNLEWAFLRWRPRDDLDLRLGRLGFDAFLLSDYRNVGYAYPWMRPPSDFYGPLFTYHFDGADLARRFSLGEGYLTLKAYAGHSNDDTLAQQPGAAVAIVGARPPISPRNFRNSAAAAAAEAKNLSLSFEYLGTVTDVASAAVCSGLCQQFVAGADNAGGEILGVTEFGTHTVSGKAG